MESYIRPVLVWAAKNERHLGAIVFFGGFVTDIVTFGGLPLHVVNYIFISYLMIAIASVVIAHYVYSREHTHSLPARSAKIFFPLAAQFVIGGLLSGTLIFYTRSGSILVSWPFLLILAFVFVGSEYFRQYKDRLVFQSFLLYVSLYSYILFAYPYYTHTLTKWSFFISTGITLLLGGALFATLYYLGKERFQKSIIYIGVSCMAVTLIVLGSYLKGILPPLPLSLKDAGVYHSVVRTGGEYHVFTEPKAWYERFLRTTIHVAEGEQVYAYTSVFAPVSFTTTLVHKWERYDENQKKWIQAAFIPYTISGGRDGGYRGYSAIGGVQPGKWRVSVLSASGQALGRITFTVIHVDTQTPFIEEVK